MKIFQKNRPSLILLRFCCATILFWTTSPFLCAQTWNGHIRLYTQLDVDSFPLKYGAVEYITGSLGIGYQNDTGQSDIVDLTPLSSLRRIGERFSIANTCCLEDLHGLENLDSVGYWTEFWRNNALRQVDALQHLHTVGKGLGIHENPVLEQLDGLANVQNLGVSPPHVQFAQNPRLRHFNLKRLRHSGDFEAWSCDLENLDGLDSLETAEYFYIGFMPRFKNASSVRRLRDAIAIGFVYLDSLETLAGMCAEAPAPFALEDKLWIINCEHLKTLDGLDKLIRIEEEAIVASNDSLQTLSGLANLRTLGSILDPDTYEVDYDSNYLFHACAMCIIDNPSLVSVGMPQLRVASLAIDRNESLTQLQGLDSLRVATIGCGDNPQLRDIGRFDSLERATDLIFYHNHLDSIVGFNYLKDFNRFSVWEDTALQVWKGLEAVDSTNGIIKYKAWSSYNYIAKSNVPWDIKLRELSLLNNAHYGGEFELWLSSTYHAVPGDPYSETEVYPASPVQIRYGVNCRTHFSFSITNSLYLQGLILPHCDSMKTQDAAWFNEYRSRIGLSTKNSLDMGNSLEKMKYSRMVYISEPQTYPKFLTALQASNYMEIVNTDASALPPIFPNLQRLTRYPPYTANILYLYRMNNLKKIEGFGNVQTFTGGIELYHNDSLTDCRALCHLLSLPPANRPVQIQYTPFPCDTKTNILAWCDTLNTATGQAYEPLTFRLSPNPASTEVLVEADGTVSGLRRLVLLNAAGVVLFEQFFPAGLSTAYRLPLTDLPSGLYWVAVYTDRHFGVKGLTVLPN